MKSVYKFVTWEAPAVEELKDSSAYQLMEKLNRGEELTREEKKQRYIRRALALRNILDRKI